MLDWVSPWWQAMNLPTWEICGFRRIPSLSVWHAFALENLGNAYLCGGRCTIDDAASLILIVTRDMAGGQRLVARDRHRHKQLARIARRLRKVPFADMHAACNQYVRACYRVAGRWQKEGAAGKLQGAPHTFHLVCALSGIGWTWKDAWNAPIALARCVYDTTREDGGDDTIMHPRYERLAEQWAAQKVSAN